MSISGIFLVLFLLFHSLMNIVVIISPSGYNAICAFLGANWYAVLGTAVLAGGFVIHILYALFLTFQNMRARGSEKYAVTKNQKSVEWTSQNMFVLGLIIFGFLALHFYNFWYKMQFAELTGIQTGRWCCLCTGIIRQQNLLWPLHCVACSIMASFNPWYLEFITNPWN